MSAAYYRAIMAEAENELAILSWNKFQAAPVARFIADVDDVTERFAALDASLAKLDARS